MTDYADGKMLAEIEDGVGTITFNNPEKRNAMSLEMTVAFAQILEKFENDPEIRVVILAGAGDKSFNSGGDISEYENRIKDFRRNGAILRQRLNGFSKPMIARIRGFCVGGGLLLANQADIRIAAEDSQFGIPVVRLGNPPPFEGVQRLVAIAGVSNAAMMVLSGARYSSAEALRMGLVNRVTPNDELTKVTMEVARTIAGNAPLSVAAAKLSLWEGFKAPEDRDPERIQRAMAAAFNSGDFKEGRAAFREKRQPKFRGV